VHAGVSVAQADAAATVSSASVAPHAQVAAALGAALAAIVRITLAWPPRAGSIDLLAVASAVVSLATVAGATVSLEQTAGAATELVHVGSADRAELAETATATVALV
jgi:hypothetical protein